MAINSANAVSFFAQSGGTGDFVFGSSRDSFLTPAQAVTLGEMNDGATYSYLAQNSLTAPTQREWGDVTFTASTNTLARTTVRGSVDNGVAASGSPINFSTAPLVSLTILVDDFNGVTLLAPGNLDFYVATTGSDSNIGSASAPFLTIQHAVDVAVSFDYGNSYVPTIHVADGTYVSSATIGLPNLVNRGNDAVIIGNTTNPQNCILSDGGQQFGVIFAASGSNSSWSISGFEFQTGGVALAASGLGTILLGNNNRFNDVTNGTGGKPFQATGGASIVFTFGTLTIVNNFIEAMFEGLASFASIFVGHVTINLPSPFGVGVAWIYLSNFASMTYRNVTVNGTCTGNQINTSNMSFLETDSGSLVDLPGQTAGNFVDSTSAITNTFGSLGGFFGFQIAQVPDATNITPGTFAVFKDTNGGGVYLAYNDSGSIKKVALT